MATTFKLPLMVLAPKSTPFRSTNTILRPLAITTVVKSFKPLFKVMSLAAPASNVAVPLLTSKAPDWVIAPLATTFKLPLMVLPPRSIALTSFSETFPAITLTALPKSFKASVSVIS